MIPLCTERRSRSLGSVPVSALLLAWSCRLGTARLPLGYTTPQDTCPGAIEVDGYGKVELVAATYDVPGNPTGKVHVEHGKVVPHYKSRGYFADACDLGKYNSSEYSAIPLLGKSISFTTNLAEAGCGCNVAMYLTSLHQNPEVSDCEDYYCDANLVCGVACHEIDIMEANAHAFRTSLHTEDDRWGLSEGLGGEADDWTTSEYGRNGTCINTSMPFQITASFPEDNGVLSSMVLTVSQESLPGQLCNLTMTLAGYDGNTTISKEGSGHGMIAMAEALRAGMTPIVSLWGADDMGWMDGRGSKHTGPCKTDSEMKCPEEVRMYNFIVKDLPPSAAPKGYVWILGLALVVVLVVGAVAVVQFMMSGGDDESHEELVDEEENSSS